MANKTQPKKFKMGYELRIKIGDRYTRVGNLFMTKQEALDYRVRRHPNIKVFSVMGINVNAPDKIPQKFMFQLERKDDKNKKVGTHGGPANG